MEINNLHELLDDNLVKLKSDKKIIENILNAERDWDFEVENLNDFIDVLEKDIGGVTTEENLKQRLKKYNKNLSTSWNCESLCYLIEIFKYTSYSNLKLIFDDLSTRLNQKSEVERPKTFKKEGYPTIKAYEDYFEIKALNINTFKRFEYQNLKKIKLNVPQKKWWYKSYLKITLFKQLYLKKDLIKLIIINRSSKNCKYLISDIPNSEFNRFIRMINHKINTVANNV